MGGSYMIHAAAEWSGDFYQWSRRTRSRTSIIEINNNIFFL